MTIVAYTLTHGGASLRGNRDGAPPPVRVTGCIVRAHANLTASVLTFAVLVLVASVEQVSTPATASVADVFLAARVADAGLYRRG